MLDARMADFVAAHINDDPSRLLLSAHRYPDIDVPAAVVQIEARRQLRQKLPEWYADMRLILAGRVPAEQCSSELTARYKRRLVVGSSLCDLTGGMGVDCYYMSQGLGRVVYVERQPHLCEAARHNFSVLGATHIEVCQGDGVALLDGLVADTFYLDPARRSADGQRVYDVQDCEPNVLLLRERLLAHCRRLVVKVSPMADVSKLLAQMPGVSEVHVVAVRNECKEVLLVFDSHPDVEDIPPRVFCIDLNSSGEASFVYRWDEEAQAQSVFAATLGQYLYEPGVAVLKAGAFRLVGQRFDLEKLDVCSHLYTSACLVAGFPGRIFRVEQMWPFASRMLRHLGRDVPQANITARNFPLTADQLRSRMGIRDGGEDYLFASTSRAFGTFIVKCRRVPVSLILLMVLNLLSLMPLRAARRSDVPAISELVSGVAEEPLSHWVADDAFVCMDSSLALVMQPEQAAPELRFDVGGVWRFHSVLTEENWMGQPEVLLRFISPEGIACRYVTGQAVEILDRQDYVPQVVGLYPLRTIHGVDSLLRARTLYILIDDERVSPLDSISAAASSRKFCPVVVDSVSYGNDQAPLRVFYRRCDDNTRFAVYTALPESRHASTTTPIGKCFSTTDPVLLHPDISPQVWSLICQRRLQVGMTVDEVRLSVGRPYNYETHTTRQGIAQIWYYRNGLVLEIWDGCLRAVFAQP